MITKTDSVQAYDCLLIHGVKPSIQRMAVMDYLLKNHIHPTVEDIYAALSPDMPTLSRTTIYNTLRLLVEKGAVRMLTIDEKHTCFDADTSRHSHFLCLHCGRVFDVACPTGIAEGERLVIEGHDAYEVHTYYRGICRKCKQEAN